jgi:predicted alpha/beta-fold hydrolase
MYGTTPEKSGYRPAWWLPGGHLKTIWGKLFRKSPAVPTSALTWDTNDGDFLELRRLNGVPHRPRLLLLHGLEGSQRSHYARAFFHEALARGWGADLLLFRSCGDRMNRRPRFYHSGETGDLDWVAGRILNEFPSSPLVIAGVSLGGNVLLKWLGELGSEVPKGVAAAAAISVPFDLAKSSLRIGRGFSRVYQRVFLGSLVEKAADIQLRYPELLPNVNLRSLTSLWEFDNSVTAPIHGFADARDYYERSSAIRWIGNIRLPTLLLSASDDPFLPPAVLDDVRRIAENNPALAVEFTKHGGHVGFAGGANPLRPAYYAEARVCDFLGSVAAGA